MAKPPKDDNKSNDRRTKYGDKADKYADDKYQGDGSHGDKSQGDKPPA